MTKGYIANLDLSDQEEVQNPVVGEGSNWFESMPFNGQIFNCVRTAQPFSNWVFNKTYCRWDAPTPMPQDGKRYMWDETTTSWIEVQP